MTCQAGRCVVCTLFEGEYHHGVAALVNSLSYHGFRGTFCAGYRGSLPAWANALTVNPEQLGFNKDVTFKFISLRSEAHLTNLKPDLMLQLWDEFQPTAEAILYLDPDIIVNYSWRFFTEWLTCGIAVCEDVNSPMSAEHPRRVGWRRAFGKRGIELLSKQGFYANGGMVGVHEMYISFLRLWRDMQEIVWEEIGGNDQAGITGGKALRDAGFASCFDKTDQDALNAAIDACGPLPISFLNKQAMGFVSGEARLPHALGAEKPWRRKYVIEALRGKPPRIADKVFWNFAEGPILTFTPGRISRTRAALALGGAIGRFMRRA